MRVSFVVLCSFVSALLGKTRRRGANFTPSIGVRVKQAYTPNARLPALSHLLQPSQHTNYEGREHKASACATVRSQALSQWWNSGVSTRVSNNVSERNHIGTNEGRHRKRLSWRSRVDLKPSETKPSQLSLGLRSDISFLKDIMLGPWVHDKISYRI